MATSRPLYKKSSARVVVEKRGEVRVFRWLLHHAPLWMVVVVVSSLRLLPFRSVLRGMYWRVAAQDSLVVELPRQRAILKRLGPMPPMADTAGDFRYRLPFWWMLATSGTPDVLGWADSVSLPVEEGKDGVGFVYASLAAHNPVALGWALKRGLSANDMDGRGNSLLAFVMRRTTPDAIAVVQVLLSHGADWYHKGSAGESAHDVAQDDPFWLNWWLRTHVAGAEDSSTGRQRRKM